MSEEHDRQRTALGPEAPEAPQGDRASRRRGPDDHRADEGARRFAIASAAFLARHHCEDVVIFDVRRLCDITDYILIATGTSDRQMLSIARDVQKEGDRHGMPRFGRDIDGSATWLVLDFVDIVVHLFDPDTRAHYDLEMFWGDAPKVDWSRDGDAGSGPSP